MAIIVQILKGFIMSDRLHEIMAEIGVLHNELIKNKTIENISKVLDYIDEKSDDVKEHYLKLLLQYYFQENNIDNFKELLLLGYKFDMRIDDLKEAFLHIENSQESVIEFMEDNVVFIKDTNIEEPLMEMHKYYISNEENRVNLEQAALIIRKNRYVCAYAYKNKDKDFARFFLNDELAESLKRDLPYLLK